jgi:hypothetical protein
MARKTYLRGTTRTRPGPRHGQADYLDRIARERDLVTAGRGRLASAGSAAPASDLPSLSDAVIERFRPDRAVESRA